MFINLNILLATLTNITKNCHKTKAVAKKTIISVGKIQFHLLGFTHLFYKMVNTLFFLI